MKLLIGLFRVGWELQNELASSAAVKSVDALKSHF